MMITFDHTFLVLKMPILHNKQISNIETQKETQNIRLGNHDLSITSLYNSLAQLGGGGNNFFAAIFYKETNPGLRTFAYFLT